MAKNRIKKRELKLYTFVLNYLIHGKGYSFIKREKSQITFLVQPHPWTSTGDVMCVYYGGNIDILNQKKKKPRVVYTNGE